MPATRSRRAPALVAASAAFACAASASAAEYTRMEPVWITASAPDAGTGQAVPALVVLPPGWSAGDAAAVVLSDVSWPGPARGRLVAALLAEGAAVMELDVNTVRGSGPESARTGPTEADVRGAVQVLQRDAGAGLVVAVGRGAGGDAAVLAALAAHEEPGDGLAAGASLGPGPAAFALGGVPSEGQMGVHRGWPVRAGRLCAVLAAAAAPPEARTEAGCRRALIGPGEGSGARRAGP